ncbi:hypothetical protein HYS28_01925, partial [Candidatus Uhrbacteria bacterium]|nr:hypothetical protein [Candidatus Uhrbacteria bacterium]
MRRPLALLALAGSLLVPSNALAQSTTATNSSIYTTELGTARDAAGISSANPGITDVIGYIIAGLLSVLAVVFLVLVVYAGVLWMTAAGNGDQVKKAQRMLRDGVIGLIIILSSYA